MKTESTTDDADKVQFFGRKIPTEWIIGAWVVLLCIQPWYRMIASSIMRVIREELVKTSRLDLIQEAEARFPRGA